MRTSAPEGNVPTMHDFVPGLILLLATSRPAATPNEAVEQRPAKQQPAEQQPVEQQPAEQQPVEQQPAEQQPAEQQPAEQQPAEQQPAEQQPVEQQPVEQQPAEQQPAEQHSADDGAGEPPGEAPYRVEGKPAEAAANSPSEPPLGEKECADVNTERRGSYPPERVVGKPTDVESDLNDSFPKNDALLPNLFPQGWADFKEKLYEDIGVKLAMSYQSNVMYAPQLEPADSVAAAGFFLLEAKWDMINRGKDYQGGVVTSFTWAHNYGGAADPLGFQTQTGSILFHDAAYGDIGFFVGSAYWEQWFGKERATIRLGQQGSNGPLDFFRFADLRSSFNSPTLSFPAGSIPFGPSGLGATFKWWLEAKGNAGLYLVANVADINSEINDFDWTPIFKSGDVFVGTEIGYNWITKKDGQDPSLDHLHLTFFYASEPSLKAFESEAGWGLKVAGEKQLGRFVLFSSYVYNNAKGGGFGMTSLEHNANVGFGYTKPFKIKGEVAASASWAKELDGGGCGILDCRGDQQSQLEAYWKVMLTPDLSITPGLQLAINPLNNPNNDVVWIPTLRARAFF